MRNFAVLVFHKLVQTNGVITVPLHLPRLLKEVLNGEKARHESCRQAEDNRWIATLMEDRAICRLNRKEATIYSCIIVTADTLHTLSLKYS